MEYDGAGRVVGRSRDFFAGTEPGFTRYTYDNHSRVVKKVSPAISNTTSPITTTFRYTFASGLAKCIETRLEGTAATDQVVSREMQYLPNSEPSAGNFVKPFITCSANELQQSVRMAFDGLGRPISVTDPSGVQLSFIWDGLSRLSEKRLSNKTKYISNFSIERDDENCVISVKNLLSSSSTVTKSDFAQRPISRTTPDETLTYTYDQGSAYSKQRLVSVKSSKSIQHNFEYNIRGKVTQDYLSIDGHDFTTTFDWTDSGELLWIHDADGTTSTRTFHADGKSVAAVKLADPNNVVQAAITLSEYDDVVSRPLVCDFANGIKASIAGASGAITSITLNKGNSVLHRQEWNFDAFSRIGSHNIDAAGGTPANNSFRYSAAGTSAWCYSFSLTLISRFLIAASDVNGAVVTQYTYDAFGKATADGPDVARYKFSGKERFSDLYYFGARFYDPDVSLASQFV